MYDYKKALIPYPQKIEDGGALKLIAKEARPYYKLSIANVPSEVFASAVEIIKDALTAKVMPVCDTSMDVMPANELADTYEISFGVCTCAGDRADAYTIEITEEKATILGYDAGGAYYAAVTFAKLLTADKGNIYLPITKIVDYPDFAHRGQFLEDRYGSDFMSLDEYKDAIKYLAAMKYNTVTIGLYGCWQAFQYDNHETEFLYIPFKKYPELQTPRQVKYYSVAKRQWIYKNDILPRMFTDDYFGDLIAYGKKHNIKVKPLFNSLGHNTLIPRIFPEVSAKDENGELMGKGFCTRNPETYKLMFSLYDEIIDRYLTPNGIDAFEVGLDEVSEAHFCKCEKCREASKAELMIEYVIELCKYLKSKGMKSVYIYHDMFFKFEVIGEEMYKKFEEAGVADVAVIDWWSYRKDENLFGGKELSSFFRGIIKPFNGYYHWMIPMEYNDSIYGCAKRAQKYGFEGIESYSGFEYCFDRTFKYQADLGWNINELENREFFYDRYAYDFCPDDYDNAKAALNSARIVMEALLAPNLMSGLEYYHYSYKGRKTPEHPTNFPGHVYQTILNSEAGYTEYFKKTRAEAKKAIDFFKDNIKSDNFLNNTWLAVCMHYYNYANIYLTTLELYNKKAGKCEVYAAFKALLDAHERFMLVAENARIEGNVNIYQRNHSITRQWMVDVLNYCDSVSDAEFKFDITDFKYLRSDVFFAIR